MTGYVPALRFAGLTRVYDPLVRVTSREARLLDRADLRAGDRVLDLGCDRLATRTRGRCRDCACG